MRVPSCTYFTFSQCHSFDYPGPQFVLEHLLQQAGPGLGLVGLQPGLTSQRGNWLKYHIKIQFSGPEYTHGQPHNSTHHMSCQVACARNHWLTGSPKRVSSVMSSRNLSKMPKFSTCHRYKSTNQCASFWYPAAHRVGQVYPQHA
jgi:hypothetical protein